MDTTLNPVSEPQLIDVLKSIDNRLARMESSLDTEQSEKNDTIWFDDEDIMDIHQASIFTGLSISSIYTRVSKRKIPHDRFESKLFFSKKKLTEWFDTNKVTRKTIKT